MRKITGPQPFVGLDEIAGSAGIGRLTDNAVVVEFHKQPQENEVLCTSGLTRSVAHEKTVTIAKAKDGLGTNWRIAADLEKDSLTWTEHGIIKTKAKGGRA